MFTGLVETLAPVVRFEHRSPGARLVVDGRAIRQGVQIGSSVAVNGCCLTVVEMEDHLLHFDLGPETLKRTNLGRLKAGEAVNLERSLRLGDPVGGHLVTGHVDAVGEVVRRVNQQEWSTCWFSFPEQYQGHIVPKGCVAVDGVSLTVVDVEPGRFSVMLIPHTLAVTTLGRRREGDVVNLETDLLAKYVEQQLAQRLGGEQSSRQTPAQE